MEFPTNQQKRPSQEISFEGEDNGGVSQQLNNSDESVLDGGEADSSREVKRIKTNHGKKEMVETKVYLNIFNQNPLVINDR